MVEAPKPMSRKTQMQLDEELEKKLHDEELTQIEAEKAVEETKKLKAQQKRKP